VTALRVLDVEVTIPPDVIVVPLQSISCVERWNLRGPSLDGTRALLEETAIRIGYKVDRSPDATTLRKGNSKITVLLTGIGQLAVTADDPDRLPRSRVEGAVIMIGSLRLNLGTELIESGRERHDGGSNLWVANWNVTGFTADELMGRILQQSEHQGLKPSAHFRVNERWLGEASSPERLLKIIVVPVLPETTLSLELKLVEG
jgi:hypothetical protein